MSMSDNYIGIAMGLDVTDLKAGISEANKQIQLANSEFKAASSEMEDWTKTTGGLKAKINQLSTVLEMQKKKLSGIQAEYDKVVASQGENSEAARRLKVQLNNQKSVVNSTERELSNYKETLNGAEKGTIDLANSSLRGGKAISKMGEEAKKSSDGFTVMKGAISNLIAKGMAQLARSVKNVVSSFFNLSESTREFRSDMAKLETGFTEAGFSAKDAIDTYTTLYGVLGDTGKATEASAHLAQLTNSQEELSQWTTIATGIYATFGDSLPIQSLMEAANETSKTGEVTGTLANALNWAGVNENEFKSKIAECSTEQERQKLIAETLNGIYGESAEKFKELNKDVIESQEAEAKLTKTISEFGAVAEPIMTSMKVLANELLQAMLPFVQILGKGMTDAMNGVSEASDKIAEGLGGMLDSILGKIIELLPTLLDAIIQVIPTIIASLLESLPQLMDVIMKAIAGIVNMLSSSLPAIVEKVMGVVPQIVARLIDSIPTLLNASVNFLLAIVRAIPQVIVALQSSIPDIITAIVNALGNSIPILIDGSIQLFMAMLGALPVLIKSLVENMPRIVNAIVSGLIGAIPQIMNGAIQLFMGIINAIPKIVSMLIKEIPSIIVAIVNSLSQGSRELFQVGVNLFQGLWNGIKDTWNKIVNWLNEAWNNLTDSIKNFFGIHSPSKLMAKMGSYIGEGLGEGIKDSIPDIKKDLDKVNGFIAGNLGNVKAGISGSASDLLGASRSFVKTIDAGLTINYNGTLSRKQIRKLEDDHYRSIRLRLKSEGAI